MKNIRDIGNNQFTYKSEIKHIDSQRNSYNPVRFSQPKLQPITNNKILLSYFVTVLIDQDNFDILMINIMSMPNGLLEPHYNSRPLQSGKRYTKLKNSRFRFSETPKFELLTNQPSRIRTIYFNHNMSETHKKKLKIFEDNL